MNPIDPSINFVDSVEIFGMETLNVIHFKVIDFNIKHGQKPTMLLLNPNLYDKKIIGEGAIYNGLNIYFSVGVPILEIY